MSSSIASSTAPLHQRFEEEKESYQPEEKKQKKTKHRRGTDDNEEDELVNEIDSFLIEDDDI
jgi:hypothetical protein